MDMDTDVVIAGAGPVGLLLACEIKLAGAEVLVVERRTGIDPTAKAGAVNAASARLLDRRGLLPHLADVHDGVMAKVRSFAAGRPGAAPRPMPRYAAHFGGIMIDPAAVDESDPALAGLGPAADAMLVPQQAVEALLGAWAAELGIEVRRGVELTGFEQDGDGVTVRLSGGEGADGDAGAGTGAGEGAGAGTGEGAAGAYALRTGWLVGADGGRSTVRKLAGFAFPGTDPEITGHQAMVTLEGAEKLRPGWNATPTGVYCHGPMPGRILTVQFDGPPADRTAPITAEELTAAVRRVTGEEVTVTAVHSATRFTDNARLAEDYRRGRVLLAGDAAHVHSPFGGQGLNLGLGDAVNLGWKLAATARGTAPEGLLDSYTAERRPVAAQVLDWTRAQITLMRPRPHERALRAVMGELLATADGATQIAKQFSGALQRVLPKGGHPLTGTVPPELAFADGSRLADHFTEGGGVLFRFTSDAPHADARVRTVTVDCPGRPDLAALLVRPDGFTAWAADTADPDPDGLAAALDTWFGRPRG